ncbi:hypothetical protein LguiB_018042 [Lonicera macranthoides]
MPTFLSLVHNKLEGFVPESLGKLINLELLDLSNNNLCEPIPKSFEGLRYIQYFNVFFNKLQGEIPTRGCFANFKPESFGQNDGLCGVPRLQHVIEHAAWRAETRAGKWSSGCGHERAASEFSAWKLRRSTSSACGHVPQWLKLIVV